MLTNLRLEGGVNKQLQKMDVRRMFFEMSTERFVDKILQQERIVNTVVLGDVGSFIPAWFPATGDGGVHDVVSYEEECLEPFYLPP
mmetsp:Transcript_19555/g.28441  ORF Transcript_19555/g.28441 Transcript_19555/m.28441 type:complete len:86 (+) Transcript_19555:800-1057(+)